MAAAWIRVPLFSSRPSTLVTPFRPSTPELSIEAACSVLPNEATPALVIASAVMAARASSAPVDEMPTVVSNSVPPRISVPPLMVTEPPRVAFISWPVTVPLVVDRMPLFSVSPRRLLTPDISSEPL